MVFIGVDLDQIDKIAPRWVKSAPVSIELNQHFGSETDLLDLECIKTEDVISHFPNHVLSSRYNRLAQILQIKRKQRKINF